MPERVQRKRTKGWKMPPDTVYVGRPTKWGNPFVLATNTKMGLAPDEAVRFYKKAVTGGTIMDFYKETNQTRIRWQKSCLLLYAFSTLSC